MSNAYTHFLTNKRILLGVTGGIAAYKSAELLRLLQSHGAIVRVVMTDAATKFITPLTMQALSGLPVHIDLLDVEAENAMGHIELARWADLILIAPASANFIARFSGGHGSDLLSTLCLAADCTIAIAPAMNQAMWHNPQTQENMSKLAPNTLIFGPESGVQACGEEGFGRLMGIDKLVKCCALHFSSAELAGKKVVITAGPTREAIDPVRYISNHSSGKQGYALATACRDVGANVILITGPTNLLPPEKVGVIHINSADEMYDAVMAEIENCDIFIGVAAVADYKPVSVATTKIKKSVSDKENSKDIHITLTQNRDIIAAVANLDSKPFTVGFAAETEYLERYAKQKLEQKNLDMVVANNVADTKIGFNSDNNAATLFWSGNQKELNIASKQKIATQIVAKIVTLIEIVATKKIKQ